MVSTKEINNQIRGLKDKGGISDGSHTFGELYEDRAQLFAVICNQNSKQAWKSWLHADGSMFKDYFIVGVTTEEGDFSYHYHKALWDLYEVKELERAPEWDGHTREDIERLHSLRIERV